MLFYPSKSIFSVKIKKFFSLIFFKDKLKKCQSKISKENPELLSVGDLLYFITFP